MTLRTSQHPALHRPRGCSADPQRSSTPGAQRGFSVVELMIAMTISLLLLAGVMSVMYTSRVTYDENARIARLQEYARASVELLLRDLRSAGNQGCARFKAGTDSFVNALTAPTVNVRYNFARAVEGYEGTSGAFSPAIDAAVITSATLPNDIIAIRTLDPDLPAMRVSAPWGGGVGNIPVEKPTNATIPAGTPLVISDCLTTRVFTVSSAVTTVAQFVTLPHATTVINPGTLAQMPQNDALYATFPAYKQSALVTPVTTAIYYIAPTTNAAGGPALWRVSGNNFPQELVEGVERLEIQYGEDTNGDLQVDVYRNANAVANWNNVLSVSLAILMRSPDQGADAAAATRTYNMLGTVVGPFADRRPRILFTTTAAIRNRFG
jgi:type IV pilus assembly protein PilW